LVFSLLTSASASAQALQFFTYTGTEDASYTLSYTVDGTIVGDAESVSARLGIFGDTFVPRGEGTGASIPIASSS
jgi:hypothetical protein